MLNKVYKSKANSNAHQVVPPDHPMLGESLGFLHLLHQVYGTKRPVKYFGCCNTFVVWKGSRGYLNHPQDPIFISMFLDKKGLIDTAKTLQILALHGFCAADSVSVPGFDLEHANYLSLANLKSKPPSCNPKDYGPGEQHDHRVSQPRVQIAPFPRPRLPSD